MITKRVLNISIDETKTGSKSQVFVKDQTGKLFEINDVKLGIINGLHSPVIELGEEIHPKSTIIV